MAKRKQTTSENKDRHPEDIPDDRISVWISLPRSSFDTALLNMRPFAPTMRVLNIGEYPAWWDDRSEKEMLPASMELVDRQL
jgi:hypothetical protein